MLDMKVFKKIMQHMVNINKTMIKFNHQKLTTKQKKPFVLTENHVQIWLN